MFLNAKINVLGFKKKKKKSRAKDNATDGGVRLLNRELGGGDTREAAENLRQGINLLIKVYACVEIISLRFTCFCFKIFLGSI